MKITGAAVKEWGIKMSIEETRGNENGRRRKGYEWNAQVNDNALKKTDCFEYLGGNLQANGTKNDGMRARKMKMNSKNFSLRSI